MSKSKRALVSSRDSLSPEDIHAPFQQGEKSNDLSKWKEAFIESLNRGDGLGTVRTLIDMICKIPGEICNEIGEIASVLVRKEMKLTHLIRSSIHDRHTRREKQICVNFFTECDNDLGRDDTIDIYKKFIPWATPEDLLGVAWNRSGLAAMREILTESPEHREPFHDFTSENFYLLSEQLAIDYLDPKIKDKIRDNNMRLWYRYPLQKRIAASLAGKAETWSVVGIDDSDLSSRIAIREDSLTASFYKRLQSARKPAEFDDDGDDTATLVGAPYAGASV
ncbi:hypothetical protein AYL99_12032 [Fonsecaea erecta]|uniref:Uncharacterized protein n=1 Tax=Fonsecaea erecta TaxID=1367422 RepID=A0A178Z2X9_9EURO|nr:hypothetical protein AYL99_12032 [Fonsecaea erecta]OAP53766.1 hypothetical protein AYL99_12032 [Fonsecaea erecta]